MFFISWLAIMVLKSRRNNYIQHHNKSSEELPLQWLTIFCLECERMRIRKRELVNFVEKLKSVQWLVKHASYGWKRYYTAGLVCSEDGQKINSFTEKNHQCPWNLLSKIYDRWYSTTIGEIQCIGYYLATIFLMVHIHINNVQSTVLSTPIFIELFSLDRFLLI